MSLIFPRESRAWPPFSVNGVGVHGAVLVHPGQKGESGIIAISFAPHSFQVEVTRRRIGPIDYKIEPRDFANVREIGVGLLGEDRH
jgi:hypothetical protein